MPTTGGETDLSGGGFLASSPARAQSLFQSETVPPGGGSAQPGFTRRRRAYAGDTCKPPGAAWRSRGAARRWRGILKQALSGEQPPVPLGDDLDRAVDDGDRGVVVQRVPRARELRRPLLGRAHVVLWEIRVVDVGEHREGDEAERLDATARWTPLDELLADGRAQHRAPSAHAHPDRLGPKRRQELLEPGLPDPPAEEERIAARYQDGVSCLDPGNPVRSWQAGQHAEVQHAQRPPAQLAHRGAGGAGDDPVGTRGSVRKSVRRRGHAERAGLFDGLAQELDQRVVDAGILDAGGGEEQLHGAGETIG